MFDKHLIAVTEKTFLPFAKVLVSKKISANKITIFGFFIGILSVLCISQHSYIIGLIFLLLNRVCDGLDGLVARLTSTSDFGAFLDITLDFMLYALFPSVSYGVIPTKTVYPVLSLSYHFLELGAVF